MTKHRNTKLIALLLGTLILTGCNSSSSTSSKQSINCDVAASECNFAIVNTVADDYSDAGLAFVDLNESPLTATLSTNHTTGNSDYDISAYDGHVYHIGRYLVDGITKYSTADIDTPIWTYSTIDDVDGLASNPQSLIFVNSQKAYLIRYSSAKLWIVNPSADNEKNFKIGEIDLGQYTVDGSPHISTGIIVDGKLFLTVQRLFNYVPTEGASYIAVIDTATDKEIDTRKEGSNENLKGIKLKSANPDKIIYQPGIGLLVQSLGAYTPNYIGGIEKINPSDYSTSYIIDDNATTGLIAGLAVVSSTKGYFTSYLGWGNNRLCSFNPSATNNEDANIQCPIAEIEGANISNLVISPQGDLWVSVADGSNPRIEVVDTTNDSYKQTMDQFDYNPGTVVFVDSVKLD